ncbi:MAG: DUF4331 family protein [Chloroflexota bacterium]
MRKTTKFATLGAAITVLTIGAAPLLTSGADHIEAPLAVANRSLDITDIYAFDAKGSKNTVLVINVNPLAGVLSGTTFSSSGEYRFNVDTNGDFVADDVYAVKFGKERHGTQKVTLRKNGETVLRGETGGTIKGGHAKLYAGVKDDPFFFDLASFKSWRDPDADGAFTYTGSTAFAGVDFFRGTNISTIVLEIPDAWLGASANFWASTVDRDGMTIDRMGKPALATVFVNPFGGTSDKDAYNATMPSDDVATWAPLFIAVESVFYPEAGVPEAITGLLLPDVLHLDVATLGKSTGTGFTGGAGGILNGRTLAEDVIDLELYVVTGGLAGHAILSTDGVAANDAAFPGTFPYLAPKH